MLSEIVKGIDITSVTNKFLKENPGMVKTFQKLLMLQTIDIKLENQTFNVIAKDATMDVKSTKDQMASFGFPHKRAEEKYFGRNGIF